MKVIAELLVAENYLGEVIKAALALDPQLSELFVIHRDTVGT